MNRRVISPARPPKPRRGRGQEPEETGDAGDPWDGRSLLEAWAHLKRLMAELGVGDSAKRQELSAALAAVKAKLAAAQQSGEPPDRRLNPLADPRGHPAAAAAAPRALSSPRPPLPASPPPAHLVASPFINRPEPEPVGPRSGRSRGGGWGDGEGGRRRRPGGQGEACARCGRRKRGPSAGGADDGVCGNGCCCEFACAHCGRSGVSSSSRRDRSKFPYHGSNEDGGSRTPPRYRQPVFSSGDGGQADPAMLAGRDEACAHCGRSGGSPGVGNSSTRRDRSKYHGSNDDGNSNSSGRTDSPAAANARADPPQGRSSSAETAPAAATPRNHPDPSVYPYPHRPVVLPPVAGRGPSPPSPSGGDVHVTPTGRIPRRDARGRLISPFVPAPSGDDRELLSPPDTRFFINSLDGFSGVYVGARWVSERHLGPGETGFGLQARGPRLQRRPPAPPIQCPVEDESDEWHPYGQIHPGGQAARGSSGSKPGQEGWRVGARGRVDQNEAGRVYNLRAAAEPATPSPDGAVGSGAWEFQPADLYGGAAPGLDRYGDRLYDQHQSSDRNRHDHQHQSNNYQHQSSDRDRHDYQHQSSDRHDHHHPSIERSPGGASPREELQAPAPPPRKQIGDAAAPASTLGQDIARRQRAAVGGGPAVAQGSVHRLREAHDEPGGCVQTPDTRSGTAGHEVVDDGREGRGRAREAELLEECTARAGAARFDLQLAKPQHRRVLATPAKPEAVPAHGAGERPAAAVPLVRVEHVPLAVRRPAPADPLHEPASPKATPLARQKDEPDAAGGGGDPPMMECYVVTDKQSGGRSYHRRFVHVVGGAWIVFSSRRDGTDQYRPREQISLRAVVGFAPVRPAAGGKQGTQPASYFVVATNQSSYLCVATKPTQLRRWIDYFSVAHPFVQTTATTAAL
ncbi:hypothetical protein DIPPA_21631 [Diplonema papillatum]|nr:hypothetical protein DIPPA_21631 [Diplonema papillatum]